MDDNIKITGGIKMGQLSKGMESLMKNGVYGIKQESELIAKGGGVGFNIDWEKAEPGVVADPRYNVPKKAPKASVELVDETVVNTEIYRRAKLAIVQAAISRESKQAILQAQCKQVAYGLDKYPEPLNANTWTISETVDHIMDESIDKLHYLIMLRIKLEQEIVSISHGDVGSLHGMIIRITHMVDNAIDELDYLVSLSNREKGACDLTKGMPKDAMDAMTYALKYKESGKDTTGVPYQFEELW